MSVRFALFAAIICCAVSMFPLVIQAETYTLYDIDFGSVNVGDTAAWSIHSNLGGTTVYGHFWNASMGIDQYTRSSFRLWAPGISFVTNALYGIQDAMHRYQIDYGVEPRSLGQLADSGYYQIPDTIAGQWVFSFSGANPVRYLQAHSTAEMPFGADRLVTFNRANGFMVGWGVTEVVVDMPYGDYNPMVFSCNPGTAGQFRDTVLFDIGVTGHQPSLFLAFALSVNAVESVTPREGQIPDEFSLLAPFPNPFNSTTTLAYTLRSPSEVVLRVLDITGREVVTLQRGWREAGAYSAQWDAAGVASGVYIARLQAGEFSESKRIILSR